MLNKKDLQIENVNKLNEKFPSEEKQQEIMEGTVDQNKLVHLLENTIELIALVDKAPDKELTEYSDAITKEFLEKVVDPTAKLVNDFIATHPEYIPLRVKNAGCILGPKPFMLKLRAEETLSELLS